MYLYFAGGEAHCPRLHDYGVRRMLASFYYIRKKFKGRGYDYMERMFATYGKDIHWFMDSGAFTLQQDQPDAREVEKFLEDYIYTLKKWKKHITCAVELDLDSFMGMGWVYYARERIINETGIIPIVVHHPEHRTLQEFRRDCGIYPYMGFSIGDGVIFERNKFIPFYIEAKQHKTKLHAFGITQPRILQRFHFYSADSFTWSMGAKFGTTFVNKRWDMYRFNNHQKTIRRSIANKLKRYGIPVVDVLNDKYVAVDKFNTISWMECEQTINTRWGAHYCGEPKEPTNIIPPLVGLESQTEENPLNVRVLSPNRFLKMQNFLSRTSAKRQTGQNVLNKFAGLGKGNKFAYVNDGNRFAKR